MTPHTGTAGEMSALANTRLYRSLIAGTIALTLTLSMWTAAHAQGIETIIDETSQTAPQYHSIRQLEHAEASRMEELRRLDEIETRRLGNRANTGSAQTWRPSARYLLWLEYSELRRFRNRAPAWGHAALDAEIERLRTALTAPTP